MSRGSPTFIDSSRAISLLSVGVVPAGVLGALLGVWRDVALQEVSDRIAAGFEEQEGVLAIGDPDSAEAHAHAPTQRLSVQQSLGQRFWHEEPANCSQYERI
jgi:hypothetical protein